MFYPVAAIHERWLIYENPPKVSLSKLYKNMPDFKEFLRIRLQVLFISLLLQDGEDEHLCALNILGHIAD